MKALEADPVRRLQRAPWLALVHRFEALSTHFPKSPRAPEALFSAGQLLEHLAGISFVREDRRAAARDYRELLARFPQASRARDATLALGKLGVMAPRAPAQRQARAEAPGRVARPRPSSAATLERDRLKRLVLKGDGELPLPEQLGLKVRRVVIDPGHGGHDSGTVGRGGTREKDVSLGIAVRLARVLRAQGLSVVLTREDDRFLRLEERTKKANEAKGDLFISIHCNAAPQSYLRGVETYTLNTASDRYSLRLAARENASAQAGVSDLQFILADLATRADTEESTRLGARVQRELAGRLAEKYPGLKDLGNKQALFYVLLGVKMPAILVEASFLSNPEDERRLGTRSYQEDVAAAIAGGVMEFLGARAQVAQAG